MKRRWRNGRGVAQGLGMAALSAAVSQLAAAAPQTAAGLPEHVPGEIVVKMRQSGMHAQAQTILAQSLARTLGAGRILGIRNFQTDGALLTVRLKNDSDMDAALKTLSQESSVQYAEPNLVYHALQMNAAEGAPNDPDFAKLWGIMNTGQADSAGQVGKPGADVNVMPLWNKGITGSHDIVVAVIDTGVDHTHPDLAANIFQNTAEIEGNGKDDDGNGFVDDVRGWNFAAKTNNAKDDHNHGSHCAGTIGGEGNNGRGVVGVNWKVKILPVKFLTASGSGSLEAAVESINYARKMKVNIMSNSWGGGGYSQSLKDAIVAAKDAGILFVAAAGNDGSNNDTSPSYPASYDVENVLSVAATSNLDQLASFSNYGVARVHVAAPGVKVYSTVKDGGYAAYSGTSMATPHVAGVAALLLSANPTWSFAEIKDRLIRTSDPVRALKSRVMAKGRVNATNAFYGIVPPSSEPDASLWRGREQGVESVHPYADNANTKFEVKVPGAKYIRVIFDRVDVEAKYDKVSVESPSGEVFEELTGQVQGKTSEYVEGDTLVIRLRSDSSNTGYGFKVSRIEVIGDSL